MEEGVTDHDETVYDDEGVHGDDDDVTVVELAGSIGTAPRPEPPRRRAMIEWPGDAR